MKYPFLLSIVLLGCLLASCEKDNDPTTETILLQNDGYSENGSRNFVSTPVEGEEIAVTLGPVTNTFQVTYINLLFGGTGNMSVTREVKLKIYKDNGSTNPGELLYNGNYTLSSSDLLFTQLDIRDQDIMVSGGGRIRVSFEMVDGTGFPSFAQEFDGVYNETLNWIKSSTGIWASNDTPGLNGNWVIRAVVEENR